MGKRYQKLFAKYYDSFMESIEKMLETRRKLLITPLKGAILEVGSGTGVNFKFYNELTKVIAIEPSKPMLDIATNRLGDSLAEITLLNIGINDKELFNFVPKDGFDVIVCTLVLCTVPNLYETVDLFKRLLAEKGQLIILEHIHAKTQPKAFLETVVNPIWKKVGEGCNLNRKTDNVLKAKGFKVVRESYFKHSIDFYEAVFEMEANKHK